MIVDMINNKKLNSIVTELFLGDRKLNISIVFVTHIYFKALEILDQILLTYLL